MEKSLPKNKHWLKDLLSASWGVLNFTRKAILNVIFLLLAFVIIAGIASNAETPVVIEDNTVLKLNLSGSIVEQKTFVDPYNQVMMGAMGNDNNAPEVLLTDILKVIEKAQSDNKVTALLLDIQGLQGSGLSKLHEVGAALTKFKESGKPVIVYGDYYSQTQYYLASHADQVILHPMGAIGLDGFGRFRMYYKSALEKLKVNAHIFRVGTFKSAVEPYIRDDMSEQAKLANKEWLGDLWQQYKATVAINRQFETSNFDETLNGFFTKFQSVKGNFADFALQNNWVDQLMTRQQFDHYLDNEVTASKPNVVTMSNYLASLNLQPQLNVSPNKVGVVVAQGTIYNGKRQAGEIGGDSTAKLLKQARLDKGVKAVVLRVDSPGGSAFASEVIRNEIEALKAAGKPVIASMSSVAASGGYWISASTDEIWASDSTITGSIGIFGMFMTIEDSLAQLGITTDGIATTEMAGISPTRKLTPEMSQIIQMAIENGYDQFINLVATERGMTPEAVDKIAQGRVWSGQKAKEIGLVDNLGSYADAIAAAANKAELANYDVKVITKPLSPVDQLMMDLFAAYAPEPTYAHSQSIVKVLAQIGQELTKWTQFNDPAGAYIYCLECDAL